MIVGDMPGAGAPQTDSFHHTPFYATNNSSGWLNAQLVLNKIPEEKLCWINSANWRGDRTYPIDFSKFKSIVALGGNAEKWLKHNRQNYVKFHHPQYQKRFKSTEAYPLIDHLKLILLT